jgi:predicted amidohydrolase YtcJ
MNRPNHRNQKERNKRFSISIFFIPALVFSLSAAAQEVSRPTVIQNVRIFDGERVISNGTAVIQDGKITEVGQSVSIPMEAEIIDGAGKTLLPGLIDAHVHVWDEQQLKQSLVFGITTVVDMFMAVETMTKIKKR